MFKKDNRLTKNKEFEQIFKTGRSSYQEILGIKSVKNGLDYNKFGIIVSNKISKKAVVRNRLKRQVRAILKTQNQSLKQGFDLVILTLPLITTADFPKIEQAIIENLKKLRLL